MKDRFTFLWSSDVFSHLTNLKYIPRWLILSFDIFLCLVSYYISFYINSKIFINSLDVRILSQFQRLGIVIILQIFFFWCFHTYSGVLRYSSYVDLIKLLLAVFINIGIISLANFIVYLSTSNVMFYYSALLIDAVLSFLLLFILR
jgi:FlaA1/EpsC-like NDP-sugar epimerase